MYIMRYLVKFLKVILLLPVLYLTYWIFLALTLLVPPLGLLFYFLLGAVVVVSPFIFMGMPMVLLYRQVKKDVYSPDGAIHSGLYWWVIAYLILCAFITLVLTRIVVKYVPAINSYPSINSFLEQTGLWCYPIAIVLTSPISIIGFHLKRFMHNRALVRTGRSTNS